MNEEQKLLDRYGNTVDDNMIGSNVSDLEPKRFDLSMWTGEVIDNIDPMKLGRVKVRIFGMYEDLDRSVIPWALSETTYLGASTSNLVVPPIGSTIRGYFENGDPYKPIYSGIVCYKRPLVSSEESFNGSTSPGDSILDDAVNDLDYPSTMVLMKTDEGEGDTLNRKNGQMKITHRSGLKIQIDPNGSILIEHSMSKKIANSDPANMDVIIEGKFNLNANDDITVKAKKNVMIDSVMGDVHLGKNVSKNLVCAHPTCFVTDAPTNGGNTNVKA